MKEPQQTPHIFECHLEDFDRSVIERSHQVPVMVDFWADWCGPCHAIAPQIARVVEKFNGAVLLAKLEVDEGENMKLAGRHLVRGFPTIMLMRNGEEVDRFSGARPAHFIEEWLERHLGAE